MIASTGAASRPEPEADRRLGAGGDGDDRDRHHDLERAHPRLTVAASRQAMLMSDSVDGDRRRRRAPNSCHIMRAATASSSIANSTFDNALRHADRDLAADERRDHARQTDDHGHPQVGVAVRAVAPRAHDRGGDDHAATCPWRSPPGSPNPTTIAGTMTMPPPTPSRPARIPVTTPMTRSARWRRRGRSVPARPPRVIEQQPHGGGHEQRPRS